MQVELGLRGVSINTLQIVKRVITCSAFMFARACVWVCVCARAHMCFFHVFVCMNVKKTTVAQREAEKGLGRSRGVEKPGSIAGWMN